MRYDLCHALHPAKRPPTGSQSHNIETFLPSGVGPSNSSTLHHARPGPSPSGWRALGRSMDGWERAMIPRLSGLVVTQPSTCETGLPGTYLQPGQAESEGQRARGASFPPPFASRLQPPPLLLCITSPRCQSLKPASRFPSRVESGPGSVDSCPRTFNPRQSSILPHHREATRSRETAGHPTRHLRLRLS